MSYVPASWSGIEPWPAELADRTRQEAVALSRTQVLTAVRDPASALPWTEALVATYVWGQGNNGYGPYRLGKILQEPSVEAALARAAAILVENGAVAAYRELDEAIKGLGPAFFTKFLYFVDALVRPVAERRALILDQRVAQVIRAHATVVGRDIGLQQPEGLAAWLWSDGGWTPHRYGVYLRWMHGATRQLEAAIGWPSHPDVLELAIFSGAWNPSSA